MNSSHMRLVGVQTEFLVGKKRIHRVDRRLLRGNVGFGPFSRRRKTSTSVPHRRANIFIRLSLPLMIQLRPNILLQPNTVSGVSRFAIRSNAPWTRRVGDTKLVGMEKKSGRIGDIQMLLFAHQPRLLTRKRLNETFPQRRRKLTMFLCSKMFSERILPFKPLEVTLMAILQQSATNPTLPIEKNPPSASSTPHLSPPS